MSEALREAAIFGLFLLTPAVLAFVVCFVRGIRSERRERKERKEIKDGYQYI